MGDRKKGERKNGDKNKVTTLPDGCAVSNFHFISELGLSAYNH